MFDHLYIVSAIKMGSKCKWGSILSTFTIKIFTHNSDINTFTMSHSCGLSRWSDECFSLEKKYNATLKGFHKYRFFFLNVSCHQQFPWKIQHFICSVSKWMLLSPQVAENNLEWNSTCMWRCTHHLWYPSQVYAGPGSRNAESQS